MQGILGDRVTHLSDLFGRPLTALETSTVFEAADGQIAMRTELPNSLERFGRRFVLTVTGGKHQPVFELIDTTDVLNARSEAEEERETMEDFARVASDWLWETDAQHVFTYMSDAVEEVSGRPASFFVGRSCFNYQPLCDNEQRFREHRRVMDSAKPFKEFVYRSKTIDGEDRWYRINGSPRFDKQGGFLGYRGSGSDITAEILAREASEQRKTAMEDFASLASDWMWETDTDHIFTYMSAAIAEQTGAQPERYIGVNWYDVEDLPENVEGFAAHRALRDARKPFTDFVYKGFCDDGRAMWVRASGRPVFAQDGSFVGYRGTSSNITAEIEAQRALEAQKAALEDFAEIGSDWMWEADADHKLTMLTDAASIATGYPVSFFIGKSRLGFANLPENKTVFANHLEDLKARRPFRDLTYRIQAADGSFRWFRINGLPRFDQAGAFCGYRGTGSDITAEVEAKRELEAQKTAMEEFAAVASDWKWETDEHHRFQMFSHVIDGFVVEPQTYMGKTRFELFDYPENESVFEQHLDDLNAHRPFRNTVYVNKLGDDVPRWIRISGNPRFDDQGRFLGYRGTGTVVTAEVEAQRALAENQAAMEDFANTASDWLWEVNANEIFTMMSPAIEDFTGKSHETYIGTSILDLIGGPANQDVLKEHLKKIERREAYTNFVYQVALPDGRTVWARSNGRPFFAEDGTFLGYRGTGTNITEEVEAREQAARRAADLAEAHRLGKLGAWSYRRDTGMMTLSPEFLELTGLPDTSKTISGKRFASLVQPEDRETISVSMRKLLATAQNQAIDIS
jgi:PAS domain S-box-containing protein